MHDADSAALEQICGDMDDMESKKMFEDPEGSPKGVSITIDVVPKAEEKKEMEAEPMVEASADDESKLPPFLRKKK
jgi:hypothetical protein